MVTRAIVPAAGLGTRMAQASRGGIKELLPLGGKPMIYYTVQEALQAGVKEILVVLSPRKREIRRYLLGEGFDAIFTFIYQPQPCGLADALHRCMDLTGDQPFAVLLPDAVFSYRTPAIAQLGRVFEEYGIARLRGRWPGELDDVPVLQQMASEKKLLAVVLEGEGYDLGNPRGYEYAKELGWPG